MRILAGLSNSDSYEVEDYFKRSLAELNLPIPANSQALESYANAIVDEILDGKIEPREHLDSMAKFFDITGSKDIKFLSWNILLSAVWVYESEEAEKHSSDEINKMIIEEANLFRIFQTVSVPEHFIEMVFCDNCQFFGLPIQKCAHYAWLPKFVYRIVFGHQAQAVQVCPNCNSWKLTVSYSQAGRRKFLQRVENVPI